MQNAYEVRVFVNYWAVIVGSCTHLQVRRNHKVRYNIDGVGHKSTAVL